MPGPRHGPAGRPIPLPRRPAAIAGKKVANESAPGQKAVPVVLRRQAEPRQKAFTVLVPEGWQVAGGRFSVDPQKGGGALNSIDTKCAFTIKKDAVGTVLARWAPSYNYVDFSRAPEMATLATLFPPGRGYNGALVKPLPTLEAFRVSRPCVPRRRRYTSRHRCRCRKWRKSSISCGPK